MNDEERWINNEAVSSKQKLFVSALTPWLRRRCDVKAAVRECLEMKLTSREGIG